MTLSSRIVLGFFVLATALIVVFVVGGRNVLDRVEATLLSLNAGNASAAAQQVLRRSEETLTGHGRTVARDRDAISALSDGDSDLLTEILESTFNRMAASGDISDLVIFDTRGQVAARFSTLNLTDFETAVSPVVNEVMATGRRDFDVNLIDGYRYGAVYAFPLLSGRTPVGYGMLAYDAQASLPAIAETIGGGVILSEVGPESNSRILGLVGLDFAVTSEEVEESGSATHQITTNAIPLPPELVAEQAVLAFEGNNLAFNLVTVGDRTLVVARDRLARTVDGADIDMLLLSDFTSEAFAKASAINTALLSLAGLVAFFFVVVLVWLRMQLRPLREGTRALTAAANGDEPEPARNRSKAREIAELHAAIDKLLRQRAVERAAADEISEVVEACALGDFSRQLRIDDKDGVFEEICDKVNNIGIAANEGLEAVRLALGHLESEDLTHKMPDHFQGVFQDIALSMSAATKSLSITMEAISSSSEAMELSSRDLARSAETVAQNSERNAASLEETAAALEEMSTSVSSMTVAARDTNSSVKDIAVKATKGQGLMTQAVDAMGEIETSTTAIAKILSVIEDIAFQTNLLALNAAVEAARAGEAGMGFAVVASEVRGLAQRSSESAKEISDLINSSSKTVNKGVQLVRATGVSFDEIVSDVSSTAEKAAQITVASQEISNNIIEVTTSMTDLDQATQQNAAAARETTSAVQQAKDQSGILAAVIASFKFQSIDEIGPEALKKIA